MVDVVFELAVIYSAGYIWNWWKCLFFTLLLKVQTRVAFRNSINGVHVG
jgi:hypothetical protein